MMVVVMGMLMGGLFGRGRVRLHKGMGLVVHLM